MLFKVEVGLDWVGEDCNVDEEVKREVVSAIARQIKEKVEKQTSDELQRRVSELVDQWIMDRLKEFCDRNITITDKWGDPTERHESVTEMFKAKFDEFFNATVDKDGKTLASCGFGNKRLTRIDYLLNKKAEEYLADVTNDMDRRIKNSIDNATKAKIEEKIKKGILDKVGKLVD